MERKRITFINHCDWRIIILILRSSLALVLMIYKIYLMFIQNTPQAMHKGDIRTIEMVKPHFSRGIKG